MGKKIHSLIGRIPKAKLFQRRNRDCARAFSLVEVTIALGIVSFALLALLGLFVVGLSSSKESAMDTAVAQIALHAATIYDGVDTNLAYSYEGIPKNAGGANFQPYFAVSVAGTPGGITNTPTNFHLIEIAIFSTNNPSLTNVIQTSKYIP